MSWTSASLSAIFAAALRRREAHHALVRHVISALPARMITVSSRDGGRFAYC